MSDLTDLQNRWTELYRHRLPSEAKIRSPAQPHWPVHLDHCFARIILDNAVGATVPWTDVIKAPAVKNMTADQIQSAIALGERIVSGEADLVQLDKRSLQMRGKKSKTGGAKRKASDNVDGEIVLKEEEDAVESKSSHKKTRTTRADNATISKYFLPSPKRTRASAPISPTLDGPASPCQTTTKLQSDTKLPISSTNSTKPTMPQPQKQTPRIAKFTSDEDPLSLIATSKLTTFRKQVLSLLCAVPAGEWTSYAAMSDHISRTSHKTCARAVGNAMRNNPFAPLVPCHRVLAADGQLGGFGGGWGEEGKHAAEKKELLRNEGVRFTGNGKAVGRAWRGWE